MNSTQFLQIFAVTLTSLSFPNHLPCTTLQSISSFPSHPIYISTFLTKSNHNNKTHQIPKMEHHQNSNIASLGPQIVFFDLETTVPYRSAGRFHVLEFGAIVVCPRKLVELRSYTTLIRPVDLTVVSLRSGRTEGITRAAVEGAPTFEEVADRIYEILNGRIWAGHNIQRFDMVRIKEAFAEIGRPAPIPVGCIDSLGVLSQRFGRRAGNMKVMATLATYFGLGQQKHRSLDDVRMNLEVLKHCATVLFLESSLPAGLLTNGNGSEWQHQHRKGCSTVVTRSRSVQTSKDLKITTPTIRKSPPTATATSLSYQRSLPYARRSGFGKMTEGMKSLLCRARETRSITRLFKHSQALLR
ncbi:Protein NEN4 [Linum grandiflorum]